MSASLQTHKLGDIADLIRGITFGRSDGQTTPAKKHLPVLRAGNIQNRLILEKDLVWVPQAKISKNQLIKQNDIIMCTSSGSAAIVGKCAISEADWDGSFGAFCIGIRPKKAKCIPSYLLHYLRSSIFTNWSKNSSGANIKNIRKSELEDFSIPLPPLPEQKRIAAILDKTDAIRRKRQAAIKLADDFLRATFLEMFGDPVTNPKDWKVKPLEDLVNFRTGKLDSNAAVKGGCYPFFTCSRENFQIDTHAFDCEALLLAGNNAAAEYSVKYYKGKFNAYQRTYVITMLDDQLSFRYLQVALELKLQDLKRLSKGTNTKYLTLGILNNIMIQVPGKEACNSFDRLIKKIDQFKAKQKSANEMAERNFNSLTQRAFRGEL